MVWNKIRKIMQPYQLANEEISRQGEIPSKALKTVGSIGAAAVTGGLALNKVVPFLNKFIPQDLAIKGLSKIDPRFGKFIQKALSEGKSFDEIKEFIKNKAQGTENQEQPEINSSQSGLPTKKAKEDIQIEEEPDPAEEATDLSQEAEMLWNALSKNKTSSKDPMTSMFLKVAKNLQTVGQLQSREDFDVLHKIFEMKKHFGMSIPELAKDLFSSFDAYKQGGGSALFKSNSGGQKQSQQQPGPGQQALMQAISKLQSLRGAK